MFNKMVEAMRNEHGIDIPLSIISCLTFELNERLKKKTQSSHHVCFIVDNKTNNILSYSLNYYFKTETFPFSVHSEVNAINKLYRKKNVKANKISLYVMKITKGGNLSSSKPCTGCRNFLSNICNLTKIYYSVNHTERTDKNFELLNKSDLYDISNFRPSSGNKHGKRYSQFY